MTSTPDVTDLTPVIVLEVEGGQGLPLAKAAKLIPAGRDGRNTAPTTILRWINDGAKRSDGTRVYLECVRVSSRRILTTAAALRRFWTALSARPSAQTADPRSPAQRQRASEAAARALDDLGV